MNEIINRDEKKQNQPDREEIVQAILTGFSVFLIFIIFGVVFFINPECKIERNAYACPPPTPTPKTYNVTVIDRGYYWGDPDTYVRAGVNVLNQALDNVHLKIVMPTIQDSAEYIEEVNSSNMSSLVNSFGKRWSDDESVWLLCGNYGSASEWAAFYTQKDSGDKYNGKKIIFVQQGLTPEQLARAIYHEMGHEAGLNHTNIPGNIMRQELGTSLDISTNISEIDSGGFYGEPACVTRDQTTAFPNIWTYNNKFQTP